MQKHTFSSGFTTNFEYFKAESSETQKFTLIYTHGFAADPWGRKPDEIKKWCQKNGIGFFRYELAGHGSDAENFEKTDINIWKEQILEIIDDMVEGPVLVAGASLGGWISLLAAIKRPERVVGLLGLAAAPDFTKDYEDFATNEQKEILKRDGKLVFEKEDFSYTVTEKLLDSGRQNLLLDKTVIPIDCQTVLIQGMEDNSVYWPKALKIAEKIRSRHVMVKLLKNSNHRLNEDADIREILTALDTFL